MDEFHYRLDENHNVVPVRVRTEEEFTAWATAVFGSNRQVALTKAFPGIVISTIFLGINHRWRDDGPPLVFETMVFDDYGPGDCRRYATWDEALAGHGKIVARIKAANVASQEATKLK